MSTTSLIEEALVILGQASRNNKDSLRVELNAAKTTQGTVTRYEFRRALETCAIHISFQSASQLMDWLCEPGKSREKINVDEFWRRVDRVEAFERADINHDGVLSRSEVVNLKEDDRHEQTDKTVSAIALAASDVASTPIQTVGISAVQELNRVRKVSMFTPKSNHAVETFLSRYDTGINVASPTTSARQHSRVKSNAHDLTSTKASERDIIASKSSHQDQIGSTSTSDLSFPQKEKSVKTAGTGSTYSPARNYTSKEAPQSSSSPSDVPFLPENVTRAVDAAVAHAMKKSSTPAAGSSTSAAAIALDGKYAFNNGTLSNTETGGGTSFSDKLIPGSIQEENHILYAKLHRATFANAGLEREISSLKELLLKAQRDGSLRETGVVSLTADTPVEEAAEGLVSKVEGKGKKMLVAGITEIITRLRSETLRREVAENAVTMSAKAYGIKNEEELEKQKEKEREKIASINMLRAEIEQKSNTISILQDKLEGAETSLANEKQARKQSEEALASVMKQHREERLTSDREKTILSDEVRETLLSLKDQVLAEQKRREVIDNEVRTLRGDLLRCKEDVIVEREKLRSQAEGLLERERKVLGTLVSQLEEAAQDNKKLENYSTEMENVYLALKSLYSSLKLREDDARNETEGRAHDGDGVDEECTTVNGYTYGIDSEASWAKIAQALPAQLHPEGGGHVTAAKVLIDHRQQQEKQSKENPLSEEVFRLHQNDVNDEEDDTASIIAALTGLRSEISSLLPET